MDSIKIRQVLLDSGFASDIHCFDEIDSTNTFLNSNNIPVNSFAITEYQTNGKGRPGRSWVSAKNMNLTFSFKKNFGLSPSANNMIMFYFSFRLYNAVRIFLQNNFPLIDHSLLQIKWPNDILYGWKKLSGILIDAKPVSGNYVIGIGINCNQREFPEEINAVSLANILQHEIDREILLFTIINEFSSNISDLNTKNLNLLFNNWKNSTKILGKNCFFSEKAGLHNSGKIIDLNKDGSISIETAEGIKNFNSGEIKITSFN